MDQKTKEALSLFRQLSEENQALIIEALQAVIAARPDQGENE